MQDRWEYIEAYFTKALSSEEQRTFEVRCEKDKDFAGEVAFYLAARSATRELLMEEKQKNFSSGIGSIEVNAKTTRVKGNVTVLSRWLLYAAVACIILLAGIFYLFSSPTPRQLASSYIQDNYTVLGKTMDASRDSLQLGIAAYEQKDYRQALAIFEGIRNSHPEISDAKKFAGLAYLQTKNYDKALERFEELAAMSDRYNSGDILSAATLLQRNRPDDTDKAKQLLEKVVRAHEEGSEQAKEWLKHW